ncbi:50S ribosomal protein L10 [Helicobacter monodelphidis]|uniref:50S ribosomal protein L10 n=1 Tax=Helicobacter sp. 15-1451 TaxID=2004995 RepID=UPI000DCAF523|nr:50S ribosomal protein L10 [Helicobacter sp. 15-1451]RAX57771.1 50S ribosomal protein L10 [Helicobacter sp. 15-1451]
MTKSEKTQIIESLTIEFKESNAIAVCDYKGLSVKDLESFRVAVRPLGIKVQVVKNTLASIALKNAGADGLEFRDTNIFIWGEDQISLAKAISKFAENSAGKFVIKMGFFEGNVVDTKHIELVSKMPSRDELLGMLLSVWTGPARYFVTALDNLRKQKEEN